jgi:hypothetical protein
MSRIDQMDMRAQATLEALDAFLSRTLGAGVNTEGPSPKGCDPRKPSALLNISDNLGSLSNVLDRLAAGIARLDDIA